VSIRSLNEYRRALVDFVTLVPEMVKDSPESARRLKAV
jgi:hypothetical protein